MSGENREDTVLQPENLQKTVGFYDPSYVGYICKKKDVFSKSNVVNFKTYTTIMFPECENVLYVPVGTLLPKYIMPTMVGVVNLESDEKKKSKGKKKHVNNNLLSYAIVISKHSIKDEYEEIMGNKALEIQEILRKSIVKHSEATIPARNGSYNPNMDEYATQVTDALSDDEVIVLYVTQLGFWQLVQANAPFKFNKKPFRLDWEEGENDDKTSERTVCQSGIYEVNRNLPIPVSATIFPSDDDTKCCVFVRENNHIGTFLMTHERMDSTLSEHVNNFSDTEIVEMNYKANLCGKDVTPCDEDNVEGRLNILGVGINYRAKNCIYNSLKMDNFLKTEPAGSDKDYQQQESPPSDNGLAVCMMIAGMTFGSKTAANVGLPRRIDAPAWLKKKKDKLTVCLPISGSTCSVLVNHTACRDIDMAAWLTYILYLTIDKARIGIASRCAGCQKDNLKLCFATLTTKAGVVKTDSKKNDENQPVGGLFVSTTNMSTSFAGSIKKSREGTMTGKEYVESLYYPQLISAKSLITNNVNLVEGIHKKMNFGEVFRTFCVNLRNLKDYVRQNVVTPDISEVDGNKLEAVWIGKSVPELKYLGVISSYVNRSDMIRRLQSAVSKFDVEVSPERIYTLMMDSQSGKYYTFRSQTCTVNDKTITCQLKGHKMIPKFVEVKSVDGEEDVRWVTCGSPDMFKVELQIHKERLFDTVEKQKFLMAALPERHNDVYQQMSSGDGGKKPAEKDNHIQHMDTLSHKITNMLKMYARSLDIPVNNINNKSLFSEMKKLIQNTELVNLTYVSEHIYMSTPKELLEILATVIVMKRSGLVPEWNEVRNTKVAAYVHYNKLTGDLARDSSKNCLLYPDNGMYDSEVTETPALLLYSRYRITDYCFKQSKNEQDRIYATSVDNYNEVMDNIWFRMGSKNKRGTLCKPIRGCFFVAPLAKPYEKYASAGRFKDVIQKLSEYVGQATDVEEIVRRIVSGCGKEEVMGYIEEAVSVEDEFDVDGNVVGKRLLTEVDDSHARMLAVRLQIEDLLAYNSVTMILKAILMRQKPGDSLYDQAFEEANRESTLDKGEQMQDFEGLVSNVLGSKGDDDDKDDSHVDGESSADSGNKDTEQETDRQSADDHQILEMEESVVESEEASLSSKRKRRGDSFKPKKQARIEKQDIM